jgi:hypothetical protein
MRPSMAGGGGNPNHKSQESRALGKRFRQTRFQKVGQESIETFDVFMSPMIGRYPSQGKVLTWQVRSPRIDCPPPTPFSRRETRPQGAGQRLYQRATPWSSDVVPMASTFPVERLTIYLIAVGKETNCYNDM